jgi:hypothetical protein
MSEQPYDPYIPSGSNGAGASTAQQNGDPRTREIDKVSGLPIALAHDLQSILGGEKPKLVDFTQRLILSPVPVSCGWGASASPLTTTGLHLCGDGGAAVGEPG